MPTKKPRGGELTLEQQRANQALHQRRLRIEHVNSSGKRCRIVKDRMRLWERGGRDREKQRANQALHQRRLRIEHVNSSVKRCRIVKDRMRLWKQGVRDVVMEICCALHNF